MEEIAGRYLMRVVAVVGCMFMAGATTASAQEAYAVLSDEGKTVTFYYDSQKAERGGGGICSTDITNPYADVTKAVFDASFASYRPVSTGYWFCRCSELTTISGMENLNTESVTSMHCMFSGCSSLTSLDVSNFNTANVTDMGSMFYACKSLTSLDVSSFNTANVTDMGWMFFGCLSLTTIYADEAKWSTAAVTNGGWMFDLCYVLVGGNGTKYQSSHKNAEYARMDKPGQPGYFTDKNASGIKSTTVDKSSGGGRWYTLDGRRVEGGEPAQKDVYVKDGRKVVRR